MLVSFLIVIFLLPVVIPNHKKKHHKRKKFYKSVEENPLGRKVCLKIDHTLKGKTLTKKLYIVHKYEIN